MKCGVCNGDGLYPVIDNFGRTRCEITCPNCFGDGVEDEEAIAEEKAATAAEQKAAVQRAKYEAAMAEKRGRTL